MSKEGKEHTNKNEHQTLETFTTVGEKEGRPEDGLDKMARHSRGNKSQQQHWEMWTLDAKQRNTRSHKTC